MGQAFRRASGRIGRSRGDTSSTSSQLKKSVERKSPAEETTTENVRSAAESTFQANVDNVLEARNPEFDAMLNQMVGRIRPKPGGKLEMGEAAVVEKYDRPLPKLRNTQPGSSRYEDRPTPPGTLNVAQMRQIILLHQGKADDHDGPMDIAQIAQRFRVDAAQIQRILQFVSLPPETESKREK